MKPLIILFMLVLLQCSTTTEKREDIFKENRNDDKEFIIDLILETKEVITNGRE